MPRFVEGFMTDVLEGRSPWHVNPHWTVMDMILVASVNTKCDAHKSKCGFLCNARLYFESKGLFTQRLAALLALRSPNQRKRGSANGCFVTQNAASLGANGRKHNIILHKALYSLSCVKFTLRICSLQQTSHKKCSLETFFNVNLEGRWGWDSTMAGSQDRVVCIPEKRLLLVSHQTRCNYKLFKCEVLLFIIDQNCN